MEDKKSLILSDQQKEFISLNWDKMTLLDLTKKVFDDPELDGRSQEGRIIKEFLTTQEKKVEIKKHKKVEAIILTEEQKEFIKGNLNLKPIEIARIIFNNPNIQSLGRHVIAVRNCILDFGGSPYVIKEETINGEYRPPTQLSHLVKKVNDFVKRDIDFQNVSSIQKRNFEILKTYMHSPRFLQMINSYVVQKNRDVFEQEYVRAIWDKPDLTPDELNLYVNLCHNYVMMITLNHHKDMLDERYEQVLSDPDSKLSTTLSEMIKAKTDELNKCDKRQSELIEALNGKRAARIKEQKVGGASIATLIEWFSEQQNRENALKWARAEEEEALEEIDRLMTVGEMKAKILGLSNSELTRG